MVAQTAAKAVANANATSTCIPGYCLKYTRGWLEIGPKEVSAAKAWYAADRKHAGDKKPPAGVPVFWTGGSQGYGHIALSLGNGMIRTTDRPTGRVGTVELGYIQTYWGQKYMGWTEDLNGVLLPFLAGSGDSQWAGGDVYVEKLKNGQKDSDSVARLRYRLRHNRGIPAERAPKQGRVYNDNVADCVKFWQTTVVKGTPGPKDGEWLSNQQARVLFGPNYVVHPK